MKSGKKTYPKPVYKSEIKQLEELTPPTAQKMEIAKNSTEVGDTDVIYVEKENGEEMGYEQDRPIKGKT